MLLHSLLGSGLGRQLAEWCWHTLHWAATHLQARRLARDDQLHTARLLDLEARLRRAARR